MKHWLRSLTLREQRYVMALTLVLAVWSVYRVVLVPLADQREQMQDNNRAAAQLLSRVDAKVTRLMALRAEGESGARDNLAARLSRSTELAGLPVRRLQPNSRGEVQLRFEGVDYDTLIRWLHRAETAEGLVVIDASIGQAGRNGGVNATLTLTRPD